MAAPDADLEDATWTRPTPSSRSPTGRRRRSRPARRRGCTCRETSACAGSSGTYPAARSRPDRRPRTGRTRHRTAAPDSAGRRTRRRAADADRSRRSRATDRFRRRRRRPQIIVIPPQPIYEAVAGGTTIPPDNLDPDAPLPSAPLELRRGPVLTDDLLELQRIDTASDQLRHRRRPSPSAQPRGRRRRRGRRLERRRDELARTASPSSRQAIAVRRARRRRSDDPSRPASRASCGR